MPTPIKITTFKSITNLYDAPLHCSTLIDALNSIQTHLRTTSSDTDTPLHAQGQKLFYYAALTTQNYATYDIIIIALSTPPSQLAPDINNILKLHKATATDVDAKVRVSIACFARLGLQSMEAATASKEYPTYATLTANHSFHKTLDLLEHLNQENLSPIKNKPWLQDAHKRSLGQITLGELMYYIPTFSPLDLPHRETIQLKIYRELYSNYYYVEYFQYLSALNQMILDIQAHNPELQGSTRYYGLYHYAAIQEPLKKSSHPYISLMLSRKSPKQLSTQIESTSVCSTEVQSILRFSTAFTKAQSLMQACFTTHGVDYSLPTTPSALALLDHSPKILFSSKEMQKLQNHFESISCMPTKQALGCKSTFIQKLHWSNSISRRSRCASILSQVHTLMKYVQLAITQRKALEHHPKIYFYLGLSQESTDTFHLLLIVSTKTPTQLIAQEDNLSGLSLEEQSILNFAPLLLDIEQKSLRITCPGQPHRPNLLETLNRLNQDPPHPMYHETGLNRLKDYNNSDLPRVEINIPVLSDLHIEHRNFITKIKLLQTAYGIKQLTYRNLLLQLLSLASQLSYESPRSLDVDTDPNFYYYPCLAKNTQNDIYVLIAISHKKPKEILGMLEKEKVDHTTLSKELQGIASFNTVFTQAHKAAMEGGPFLTVQDNQVISAKEQMKILNVLNDALNQAIRLEKELEKIDSDKSQKKNTDVSLSLEAVEHLIPFIPLNRHYKNYLENTQATATDLSA